MKVSVKNVDITKIKCDLLVVNEFEGVKTPGGATGAVDRALNGLISKLSRAKEISGKLNTATLIHTQGRIPAEHVLVVGLGKSSEFGLDEVRSASAKAIDAAKRIKAKKVVTIIHGAGIGGLSPFESCRAVAESSLITDYRFKGYKTDKKDDDEGKIEELIIAEKDAKKIKDFERAAGLAQVLSRAVNNTRDLVNEPSNKMTPSEFALIAKKVAKENGIKCLVLGKKEITHEKMGAFLAIEKGSEEEGKLIVLRYKGAGPKEKTIALVGKGITFDSGGISLKPPRKMHEMKGDMAGAASVLYVMEAAAELKIKKNLLAVIPLTENMPSGGALKPGDVVTSMSGKTIEIISTDAEGRMILADAITYAKKLGAEKIIDIATLTGACIVALGDVASGILGNDQTFVEKMISAGARSGEKLWQLPLYKEYREYLKSSIADIKNASDLGKAGTSSGGTFIKEFVGDTPWAHIDIAGTADLDRQVNHYKKGPTGSGVFSIINYLLNY